MLSTCRILSILFVYTYKVLLYKVKTQYVQISNIKDTSIKHQIFGQSAPVVNGCMDVGLIWQILPLDIEEH